MKRAALVFVLALLVPSGAWAQQQAGRIVGTITGDTGEPLLGATVTIEGTDHNAITGENGRFAITGVAPGTYRVRVALLGYTPGLTEGVMVAEGGAATVDIQLESEALALEEIVVVGYGEQETVNLTGAVATVSSTQLTEKPVARVTEALQGSTPGLTVVQRDAMPGEQDIQFSIRGRGSLNSTTPLVLIDEVPGDINQLNPNDIESISILKDAASTAIYGSRAANGVILVTTKRGTNAGGLQITYDGYYGIQDVASFPEAVGPREYLEMINEAAINAGVPARYTEEYIENTVKAYNGDSGVDPLEYPWTDWLDAVWDPAPIQEHSVGIRGGNDLARFNLSFNYLDHQGMTPQTSRTASACG